ncbi:MAG TPA: hypothetical protein VFZ40_20280 [Pyrinomonadaceae bacterium]
MATDQDQARLIAERVARRLAGEARGPERPASATRNGGGHAVEQPRARMIDFVSATPPTRTHASTGPRTEANIDIFESRPTAPDTVQSPWLGRLPAMLGQDNPQSTLLNPHTIDHPSQERFGIEEATVAELVEFFEKEKQCSVDPSGKPCDHCAMCSSRGF